MTNLKTISIYDRLYTVSPYQGSRLLVCVDENYYVSGKDCEIIGEIVREDPLSNFDKSHQDEAES